MDYKSEFMEKVVAEMAGRLSTEELDQLRYSLLSNLNDVEIVKQETLPACVDNTNERLMRLFVASRRLEGMSERTICQYMYYSKLLFEAIGKDFTDIVTTDVQFFLADYERTHNICKRTLENIRKGLNGFFLWLYTNEYIVKNPVSKIVAIAYEKKVLWTLSDADILDIRDYVHNDVRTRAIVETLLATGVRVSELINIDIPDVDLENGEIIIHCAKKRNKQDRLIFLTVEAIKSIRTYLDLRQTRGWTACEKLFCANKKGGGPLTERTVNEKLNEIGCKIGLSHKLTVHVFRKTLASLLYRRGMAPLDIAYILGHADTRMSETYYISVRNEDVKRNFSKFR